MPKHLVLRGFFSICLLITFSISVLGQDDGLRTLKVEDYGKWESIGFSRTFSPNGDWFVYDLRRNNGKNELRLHNLIADTVKALPRGQRGRFSADSRWFGYFITPDQAKRKKSKKPLRNQFRLMDLNRGDSLTVKNVTSFSFSDDNRFLAMKHYPAKGKKSQGGDLIIRELNTGVEVNFGNVSEFSWQEDGDLLAMAVDADGKAGNGIQLYDTSNGALTILDSKSAIYTRLSWRENSDDLTVFRSLKDEGYEDSTQHVLVWKGLSGKKREAFVFDQTKFNSFSNTLRVVNRPLTWSKDGESIFLVTKDWTKIPEPDTTKTDESETQDLTDEAPGLQIWHSKDVQVIPEQEQRSRGQREDQYIGVWNLNENRYVQLTDDKLELTALQENSKTLVGRNPTPYNWDHMFGRGSYDMYTVDLKTGVKKKVIESVRSPFTASADGKYLPFIKDQHVSILNLETGETVSYGEDYGVTFVNVDDDHPYPEKFPFGFIGWTESQKSFFLHTKYDIVQLWADGSKLRKVTDGQASGIRHRITYVDPEAFGKPIDEDATMFVSLFGEKSKKSGYGSVVPGKALETHIWQDTRVGRLTKAKEADQYAFVSETFSDSPDYFMATDNFSEIHQLSETNPFQKDYLWGKSELISYKNHNGKELQGILYYPANYQPGKKYPMITYIYELLSDGLHAYGFPSQRNYYSTGVFSQEGYFVLRPDIVFDAGDPGISSVRTMEAAVKKVVDMGVVDEKKVGLIGHSWGGYQAGYAVTQTDIFAASVAGAGLTNFTSMYGMIAWAFGGAPESGHFEVSQERMLVPPYEDVEGYVRNSSVFNVQNLNTPLLFEVGDNDKNVDWRQGIEYYNSARRAGKQFVLLVYANEGHGLRQDKNSADYQMRILKWFGHYLKGEPAPEWITQGVPYEQQMRDLKNWKK